MLLVHLPTQPKKLFKGRNCIHFPGEEVKIQRLRHLPKHILRLYGYRVTRAHFAKDGASLLTWHLGWLLLSFHFNFWQHILWTPTLLMSNRERSDRQISVTDSKIRAFCHPKLPLKISKLWIWEERSVLIHLLSTLQTCTKYPLCDRYSAGRCNY